MKNYAHQIPLPNSSQRILFCYYIWIKRHLMNGHLTCLFNIFSKKHLLRVIKLNPLGSRYHPR